MTGPARLNPPLANGERAHRISHAAAITFYLSAGSYVGLFLLMWGPVYAGYEGWMFMYPIFLLAWIPIELGTVTAIALGIASVTQPDLPPSERRRGWIAALGGAALAGLSLPVLWFGSFPHTLLTGFQ